MPRRGAESTGAQACSRARGHVVATSTEPDRGGLGESCRRRVAPGASLASDLTSDGGMGVNHYNA